MPVRSFVWPTGGRHLWPSGGSSSVQSHRRGHLVYPATGVLTVHTDEGTSVVPANRIAWTPAGHVHRHRAHGDTDMRIVFLPPATARRMPDRPAVLSTTDLAGAIVRALTCPPHDDRYDRGARTRLLRVLVDELHDRAEESLQLPEPRDDRLRTIARVLSEAPDNNDSLPELGRSAGASSRTISRLIRTEFGMTFYEWRTQLRVHHALVCLARGEDVTHTAHACGWANPSDFITAFTRIIGSTPGHYRTGMLRTVDAS